MILVSARLLKRFARLPRRLRDIERRLTEIENDLDCDRDGSLAEGLGDLYEDHHALRSRVDEWVGVKPVRETWRRNWRA